MSFRAMPDACRAVSMIDVARADASLGSVEREIGERISSELLTVALYALIR